MAKKELVADKDFQMYAGDPRDVSLVYKDSAGAPITTITSAKMALRTTYGAPVTIEKVGVIDAPNGGIVFSFTGVEVAALVPVIGVAVPVIEYLHDVEVVLSTGLTPVTILKGKVEVTGDITR